MKNIIFCLMFQAIFLNMNIAQSVDPSITGNWDTNPIYVNDANQLTLSVQNNSFTDITAGKFTVDLKFNVGFSGSETLPPTGVGASLFDWFFFPVNSPPFFPNGGWYGVNNTSIGFSFNPVIIHVIGDSPVTDSRVSVQLALNAPFFDNINPGNNGQTWPLTVLTPLPVKLVSFKGRSTVCNQVDLSWETASEYNSEYFVVERSIDGRQFQAVGKVKSQNKATGASYKYSDEDLYGGSRYFYRLTQVDFDGKTEVFDAITTKTGYCSGTDVAMSVYPNPATEKAFIALDGFSQQDHITLEITNSLGEVVMTIQNASISTPNELKLSSIPAGVYNVKVIGFDQIASKMLIKLN